MQMLYVTEKPVRETPQMGGVPVPPSPGPGRAHPPVNKFNKRLGGFPSPLFNLMVNSVNGNTPEVGVSEGQNRAK